MILDDRGRLWGRVSLVDLTAGAALAVFALVAYLALARPDYMGRLLHRLHDEPPVERVLVEVLPHAPFLMDLVQVGDVQRNASGRLRAEIVGRGRRPSRDLALDASRLPAEVWVLTLALGAKRGGDGALRFGETPLKPGGWFFFETPDYLLEGTILAVRPDRR